MGKLKTLVIGGLLGAGVVIFATPYGEKPRAIIEEKAGQAYKAATEAFDSTKQRFAAQPVAAEGDVAAADGEAEAPKTYIDIDSVKQTVSATAQKLAGAAGTYAATAKERGAAAAQTAMERGQVVAQTAKDRAQTAAESAKGFVKGNAGEPSKDDELRAKIDEARERIAAQIAANAQAAQAAIDNVEAVAEEVAESVIEAAEADKPEQA